MDRGFLDILAGELATVRELTDGFADKHPDVAERLRLGPDGSDDPHVERLISAVAMLTARVRAKLEDEFPLVVESLLSALFPHYLRPLPSASVVQFLPRDSQESPIEIPRDATLRTERVEGDECRFRTTAPTRILPLRIARAQYGEVAIVGPLKGYEPPARAAAALVIELESVNPTLPIAGLSDQDLSMHLRVRSSRGSTNRLYESLVNECVGCWAEPTGTNQRPVSLGPRAVEPLGFDPAESILPADPRVQPGYALMAEYAAYPWKYAAVRIGPEPDRARGHRQPWPDPWPAPTMRLVLFFHNLVRDLVPVVDASSFALGSTPIVNLIGPVRAEPIDIDQRTDSYPVIADRRRSHAAPVFSVDHVEAVGADDRPLRVRPLFDPMRATPGEDPAAPLLYWHASREITRSRSGDVGSELSIAFVAEDLSRATTRAVATPIIQTTDGELPLRLPVSETRPQLFLESEAEIGGARLLFAPVAPRYPWADPSLTLRLLAHTRLNRLPLVPSGGAPEALRSMIELYDFDGEGSARNRRLRDALHAVRSKAINARVAGDICRGLDVELEVDAEMAPDRETFLLASVLERVIADFCSLNSFTRLTLRQRGHEEITRAWPPRSGTRVLI